MNAECLPYIILVEILTLGSHVMVNDFYFVCTRVQIVIADFSELLLALLLGKKNSKTSEYRQTSPFKLYLLWFCSPSLHLFIVIYQFLVTLHLIKASSLVFCSF